MKHPSKVVKAGDQVEAVVLDVQTPRPPHFARHQAARSRPLDHYRRRVTAIGSVVEGRVRKMTDFGAFIEIEEGIDGLVHVSDLSWTKRVKHPSEVLKKGPDRAGRDSEYRRPQRRLSLGSSSFSRTPGNRSSGPTRWATWCAAGFAGPAVSAFLWNWRPGVEGLCHCSEIPGSSERRRHEESPLPSARRSDFKIVKMNEAEKKIGLSFARCPMTRKRTGWRTISARPPRPP